MINIKRPYLTVLLFIVLVVTSLALNACDYITGEAVKSPVLARPQVVKDITPEEANSILMFSSYIIYIIDVRTPEEYAGGHIEGAVNIDYYSASFKDEINGLARDKIYLIYCRTGARSAGARDIMKELDFQNIYNMTGGITAWVAKGLPVMK